MPDAGYTLDDVTFPYDLAERGTVQMVSGPGFATTLNLNAPGDAQSIVNQEEPLWGFQCNFLRYSSAYDLFYSFFMERRAMGYGFWLEDPKDKTDSDRNGLGKVKTMSDGKKYLVKQYGTFRPCYRIIRGADPESIVYSGVTGTPTYVPGSGEVEDATSEGDASFTFKVPVRFTSDVFEVADSAKFGRVDGFRMVEIRTFVIETSP